jgi:hypothetical protein
MNKSQALALVRKHGYLNEFSSMSDHWFVAHNAPGEEDANSPVIPTNAALQLIAGEKAPLAQIGRAAPDEDDPTYRVTWYAPIAAAPRRE